MKAVTAVGTLATLLALGGCGQEGAGVDGVEPRAENAGVELERDAGGVVERDAGGVVDLERDEVGVVEREEGGVVTAPAPVVGDDIAAGTTINTPTDAAPTVPGNQDAVVTGEPGERPGAIVENAGERTGEVLEGTGERAMDATAAGADAATDAVSDAAITASVNAELARDEQLSALGINVDTENGRVVLRGTAPSPEAVARATELAEGVRGVEGVENELTVEAR